MKNKNVVALLAILVINTQCATDKLEGIDKAKILDDCLKENGQVVQYNNYNSKFDPCEYWRQ